MRALLIPPETASGSAYYYKSTSRVMIKKITRSVLKVVLVAITALLLIHVALQFS